ncbi:MAG TPA: HD domain-containing phosphohydrolase [Gemmatimonadaceae bacterium]
MPSRGMTGALSFLMSTRPDRSGPPRTCVVYYGSATDPTAFRLSRDALTEDGATQPRARSRRAAESTSASVRRRLCTPWRPVEELFAQPPNEIGPAVLIADHSMQANVTELRKLPSHVIIVAADEPAEEALGRRAHLSVVGMVSPAARLRVLRAACRFSCARVSASRWWKRLVRGNRELRALNDVGTALMLERDRRVLYRQIIDAGKQFTESDAGALFIMRTDETGTPSLHVAAFDIDSLPQAPQNPTDIAVDHNSAIGHAAAVGRPMVIADVHDLPIDAGFRRTSTLEEQNGFYLRSMLIVPMLDRQQRVVGVLVFANRKTDPNARIANEADADRYVISYTGREVRLARSLASQAAVSIENANLYSRIERILESFVTASVTAIDQRDPTTAGHSIRVATLTTDLAQAVERADRGTYRDTHFGRQQMRELRFAGLLHDFGKITVSENVLVKAKKLPPILLERINDRFDLIHRTIELEYYRAHGASSGNGLTAQLEELERVREIVRVANEPTVVPTPSPPDLVEIAQRTFRRPDGGTAPYLASDELHFLQLSLGTLDEHERAEIQSHVEETHRFLARIPWTDDLANLVTYAWGHHEKLDGSGYPRHLTAPEIPLQTRMMTIADIFDALTESDRPYKRAVSADKAIDILKAESKSGRLDAELVDILVESQIYRRILEVDWHDLQD